MGTERVAIETMEDWMGNQNRMSRQQSRRRTISTASDLLGQGFGPTATFVQDWNDDIATFNGFFYSVAGLSINSPDGGEGWAGIVVAEADREFGIQEIWTSHSGTPPRRYTRRWSTLGGVRSYTDWMGDETWSTSGITVVSGCTITSQKWRAAASGSVAFEVEIVLTTTFTGSPTVGDLPNTTLLQMPAEVSPVNGPGAQILQSSPTAPMTGWWITAAGQVQILSTLPGVTLAPGLALSVGGTYLL